MTRRPHVNKLSIAVYGCTTLCPRTQRHRVDADLRDAIRAVAEPTQINGPFGDGHLELTWLPPPPDFDAAAVVDLVADLVGADPA